MKSAREKFTEWVRNNLDDYRQQCFDDEDVIQYLVMDGPNDLQINLPKIECEQIAREVMRTR